MAEQFGDKTHEATPHRRQQAREQGQIVKSQDLGSALLLVLGVGALMIVGGSLTRYLFVAIAQYLGGPAWLRLDRDSTVAQSFAILAEVAWAILPLLGALLTIAVAASLVQ